MLSDLFNAGFSDAPIPANGLATVNSAGDITSSKATCGGACPPVTGLAGNDPLVQIPDALAPIAIFYYIPGISIKLNMTGTLIEEIYLQDITVWNNKYILALNPGLTPTQITALGKYPISPVHRSDGSGTSFALTTYFGRTGDGNWTADGYTAGSTSSSNFPAGELSAKGTGGVAGLVAATNGAIGYGELSYAIGAGLQYAAIQNLAGNFVLPSPAGATAAAAADASLVAANPTYVIAQAPGATSYPLSTYTYVFAWQNQDLGTSAGSTWTEGTAYDLVRFLDWIVTTGQSDATLLTYAPLPAAVQQVALNLIAGINYNGAAFTPVTTTTTTLTCTSSTTVGKSAVKCTVHITGITIAKGVRAGNVTWASSGAGTFTRASCALPASGKCTVDFIPTAASSSVTIFATYSGNFYSDPSYATASTVVNPATTKISLSCKPTKISSGSSQTTTCTVGVVGYYPSGTMTITPSGTGAVTGTFTCTLTQFGHSKTTSKCSVTLTAETKGKVTLATSYSGDANNNPSPVVTKNNILAVT
jgi:phosphate transport system substrate-binding protein